jgi:hypothetical protein
MCCFSGPVTDVGDTNIFARLGTNGTQFLVYQMRYASPAPVAMILPLPVALPARENMVRFIDLQAYPNLFENMSLMFIAPEPSFGCASEELKVSSVDSALAVEEVGDFVASFVPTLADFDRLDKRFVLPHKVWEQLPQYKEHGFAVFQLKKAGGKGQTPHPMAFEFPTRLKNQVFFPTVHIHDGKVHDKEHFDHRLYLQAPGSDWEGAYYAPEEKVKVAQTQGIVQAGVPIFRQSMEGMLANQDVLATPRMNKNILLWGLGAVAAMGGAAYAYGKKKKK